MYYTAKTPGKFIPIPDCKRHTYVRDDCVKGFAYCIYCRHVKDYILPHEPGMHTWTRYKNTRSTLQCKFCRKTEPLKPHLNDVNDLVVPWGRTSEDALVAAMFHNIKPPIVETQRVYTDLYLRNISQPVKRNFKYVPVKHGVRLDQNFN